MASEKNGGQIQVCIEKKARSAEKRLNFWTFELCDISPYQRWGESVDLSGKDTPLLINFPSLHPSNSRQNWDLAAYRRLADLEPQL